jgi:putative ABC transport system ATP-binding protein
MRGTVQPMRGDADRPADGDFGPSVTDPVPAGGAIGFAVPAVAGAGGNGHPARAEISGGSSPAPAQAGADAVPVRLAGVSYAFGEGALRRTVLRDVGLSVAPGEVVLVTGPSGSGKTTLLTLIGALRAMQAGSCRVLGQELMGAIEAQRTALRRRIGFIFQNHNLLGFLTARQNVAMTLELDPALTERERLARAGAMLEAVGLGDHLDMVPAKLSGGQRQRVAVARALVGRPGLILADEPTAALDRQSGGEVVRLLRELAKRRGVPILLVTHDPRILDLADRIVSMEDGRIVPTKQAEGVPAR